MHKPSIAIHRRIVERGGGVYVPGRLGTLVLFNSPKTGGTLALEEKDLTPERVREKIRLSDLAFAKPSPAGPTRKDCDEKENCTTCNTTRTLHADGDTSG